MYEAATLNYREVEKGVTQVERAIVEAIKRSDDASVQALTRVQLLIVSVKAEARLIKILYTPHGLSVTRRNGLLSEENAIERWRQTVDDGFRRHYRVRIGEDFADALDHDPLAKYTTLHSLMGNELSGIISLRNKLAHGQWILPLNRGLTSVEPAAMAALNAETTLSLRFRDRLLTQLGNIVVDLIVSAPSFEARFNQYFVRIRRYQRLLQSGDFDAWKADIRRRRVALARMAPSPTPAV